MSKNVSYKISWMTFLANILILLSHAYFDGKLEGGLIDHIMIFFSNMAVPMMEWFFFITAYFFFRKVDKLKKVGINLKSRVSSLLIPYIIWNTIGVFFQILGGKIEVSMWRLFRNGYLFYNGVGCGDGPLWYIARLFTFFIFAPLIYYIFRKKKTLLFLVSEMALIILNVVFETVNYDFIFFLPVFLLGGYIGLNFSDFFECWLNGERNYKGVVLSTVVLISYTYIHIRQLVFFPGSERVYRLIALLLLLLIIKFIGKIKKPTKIVINSGMYLYCAHDIVYRILRNLWYPRTVLSNELFQIGFIIISFILLFGSWMFMNRFTPSLLSLLSGGRNNRKLDIKDNVDVTGQGESK